jgi:hypothetical protein
MVEKRAPRGDTPSVDAMMVDAGGWRLKEDLDVSRRLERDACSWVGSGGARPSDVMIADLRASGRWRAHGGRGRGW